MFRDQSGNLCTDTEAIAHNIKYASDDDVEALDERVGILRDALSSLDARLEDLPEREQKAARSLLYKGITDIVFEFHLSLATNVAREKIVQAKTRTEKVAALRAFRSALQDLEMLYGIR